MKRNMKELKKQPELKDYTNDIKQCVKCGTCHAYCPIFDQDKREPMVARGKVTLAQTLLEGEVEIDKRYMENLSKCLLCGTCADKCPNLVPVDEIVMAARREITKRKGLTLFGTGLSTTLKSPALMKLMLWLENVTSLVGLVASISWKKDVPISMIRAKPGASQKLLW